MPTGEEAGWASGPVWGLWSKEKSLSHHLISQVSTEQRIIIAERDVIDQYETIITSVAPIHYIDVTTDESQS
jgi:hypothetical protein